VLENELSLFRRLGGLKVELESRYDFSTYAVFRTIDRDNNGFIEPNNLRDFFRSHGVYLSDREVLAIIRRVDTDGDARISYSEFSDFLR
jgi:Ca2+-binding EF-hand superfamily protein